MEYNFKNLMKILWFPAAIVAVLLFMVVFSGFVGHFRNLEQAGRQTTFLGSVISVFDGLLFEDPANINNSPNNAPVPSVSGSVNVNALNKLSEGLFTSAPLYLYQGERYTLRVALGDNVRPAILKNYYVNFVKDGIVNTVDKRVETPVSDGVFATRALNISGRANGALDLPPGEYDGYVNVVWDTGTQTIKFNVTILPSRVAVQPVSVVTVVNQPIPTPPPTGGPAPVAVPALSINQLNVEDVFGAGYNFIYNQQNSYWAHAQIYTTANEAVYNLTLSPLNNSGASYNLGSGTINGNGTRDLRVAMPRIDTIQNGKYTLTLNAAPRLTNGSLGNFVTRQIEVIVQISNQPPVTITNPAPTPAPQPTGDGNVTFPSGTVNLNTGNYIANRSCADGGDAVNYSVIALTSDTATLSQAPSSGCLNAGDEVLLISLQGIPAHIGNVGAYELFRVKSISGATVTFTASKKKIYGNSGGDSNLGINSGNHRVMLQRVPNYANATINSGTTVTANAFNGIRGGVLAFRVNGALNNGGKISMDGLGYRGGWTPGMQGEGRAGLGSTIPHCASYSLDYYNSGTGANDFGGGAHHCYGSGAGGGSAIPGANGFGNALGGTAMAVHSSNYLLMGGGGGAAAGAVGGNGAGIILIYAQSFNSTGTIASNGASAPGPCGVGTYTYSGGGGGGGSVYLVSPNLNVTGSVKVDGGWGLSCFYTGGSGGNGRTDYGSSL
jgi:hypothetical protein